MAQSDSCPNFSAPFHLGFFALHTLVNFLGLFTGFLWASLLYNLNGDLWQLWMRLNWEKVALLTKAVFVLNKDDTLPEMVQYEYLPVTIRPKKHRHGHYCIFSHYRFQIHTPLTFIKNLLFPRKQYLNISINLKLIIAGSALDKRGLPVLGISNPQHDWNSKAKSAQHFGH